MEALVFVVLGIVVTLLTSLVKQEHWSNRLKQTVTAVLSFIGGVVLSYFKLNGTVDLAETLTSSAQLLAIAQLIYSYGLRDSRLNKFLTSLRLESTLDANKTVEEAIVDVIQVSAAPAKPVTKKVATKKATAENKTTE